MILAQLLKGLDACQVTGDKDIEIKGIAYDSRLVQRGFLFVAIRGDSLNGHDYLEDAVQNGAIGAVIEEDAAPVEGITMIRVNDSRRALSKISLNFYDDPWRDMEVIGITGTNGKTSISYLLESIFDASGINAGVIGTVNARFRNIVHSSTVTTPESIDLMKLMREMADHSVSHVIMEVSSHALDQGRTIDCPVRTAVFSNFTRDHLDYHGDLEAYFRSKSLLFERLGRNVREGECFAVINLDDPRGRELISLSSGKVVTYGIESKADVRTDSFLTDKKGISARLRTPEGEMDIQSPLIGGFNVYNILAAVTTAMTFGIEKDAIIQGLKRLRKIPGRLEQVENPKNKAIVVDYAHTPDALLQVLKVLRPLVDGRLITVFGCGGDRDRGKRYEMGFVAGENSDIVLVTSDNPRTEDPQSIIDQVERGCTEAGLGISEWAWGANPNGRALFREEDRRTAILKAVSMAKEKDLVLIAGKGHEDYQIIGKEKRPFDDRKEAVKAVESLNN